MYYVLQGISLGGVSVSILLMFGICLLLTFMLWVESRSLVGIANDKGFRVACSSDFVYKNAVYTTMFFTILQFAILVVSLNQVEQSQFFVQFFVYGVLYLIADIIWGLNINYTTHNIFVTHAQELIEKGFVIDILPFKSAQVFTITIVKCCQVAYLIFLLYFIIKINLV